ncbi:hypothetical protein BSKO_04095 [Bryopsis sp. KO-2023]|nr:hypothetical protein BSKO_04095 [Bryopsis sp. KO-2023]
MTNVLRTEDFDSSRRRVGCLCIPSLVRLGKAVKRAFTRKPRKPLSVQASAGSGQSVFLDRLSSLVETRVAELEGSGQTEKIRNDHRLCLLDKRHTRATAPPHIQGLAPPHPPLICTTRKPYKEAALISGSEYKEPLKLHLIPPVPHLNLAEDTFAKAPVQQEAGKVETAPPPAACLATAIPTSATKLTEAAAVVQERSALETEKGPDPPQKSASEPYSMNISPLNQKIPLEFLHHNRTTVERMDLLQQQESTVAEKFTKAGLPWKVGVWKEVRSAALHLLAQYTTLVLQAVNRDVSSSRSARLLKGAISYTYLVHAFVGGLCPRCTELFSTLVEVAQKCLPPLQ